MAAVPASQPAAGVSVRPDSGHRRCTNGRSTAWNDSTETATVSVRWMPSNGQPVTLSTPKSHPALVGVSNR